MARLVNIVRLTDEQRRETREVCKAVRAKIRRGELLGNDLSDRLAQVTSPSRVIALLDERDELAAEVAKLRAENEKMRAAVIAARDVCLAYEWDMMSSEGDYERTLVDAIKATGLEYS